MTGPIDLISIGLMALIVLVAVSVAQKLRAFWEDMERADHERVD